MSKKASTAMKSKARKCVHNVWQKHTQARTHTWSKIMQTHIKDLDVECELGTTHINPQAGRNNLGNTRKHVHVHSLRSRKLTSRILTWKVSWALPTSTHRLAGIILGVPKSMDWASKQLTLNKKCIVLRKRS